MGRYIAKRCIYMVVVFFILTFLLFCLYRLMPANRAYTDAKQELLLLKSTIPEDQRDTKFDELYLKYQRQYGTDIDNNVVLYLRWLGFAPFYDGKCNGIFQGNFGFSYDYNSPVVKVIGPALRNSVLLSLFSSLFILAITIPLGIKMAVKKNSRFDRFFQGFSLIGYSCPSFIIYIVFIVFFCSILHWFPVQGMKTPGTSYTGFRYLLDTMYHYILPIICLVFGGLASITRLTRASMIDALSLDCIRTARAKGLSEKVVVYSHAWRNALVPLVSVFVGTIFGSVYGAIMLEMMFGFKGMGLMFFNATKNADYDLVMFIEVIYVFLGLVENLVADLCYGIVDPRVRINK